MADPFAGVTPLLALNPAVVLSFQVERQARRVGDPLRSPKEK